MNDDSCGCGHDHHHHHHHHHHQHGAAAGKPLAHRHHLPARVARALGPLAPVIACAVCPACLGTYAKVLAALGVGICVSERQHRILLAAAVAISFLLGVRRARATGRHAPVAVTVVGCALLVAGHLADASIAEWAGVAALLVAGLFERRWERSAVTSTRA